MSDQGVANRTISFVDDGSMHAKGSAYALQTTPGLAKVARKEYFAGTCASLPLVLLCALVFGVMIYRLNREVPVFAIVACVLMAIPIIMALGGRGQWYRLEANLRAASSRQTTPGVSYAVSLKDEGLQYSITGRTVIQHWDSIQSIECMEHGVLTQWYSARILIPYSAFGDEAAARVWCDAALLMLETHGRSEAAQVRAEIEAGPLQCGVCGHSLLGLRDPRCPECGQRLNVLLLRSWRMMQVPFWKWVVASWGIKLRKK
jgi:hypothetical protein